MGLLGCRSRQDVVSSVVYPDGGVVSYDVNLQSQVKQLTDQNGTVHAFDHDLLGREVNDRVVTLGTGIDSTVQRIGLTYEVRGMLQNITSYSSPVVGAGTVINDVQRVYNSFEQPTAEYQEHNGAVNTATSVMVGYQYADGSANTIRQTGMVYPNGRVLTMDYGPVGGMDDALSRVASLIDADGVTHLVDYTRIGHDTFVQAASPQPQIAWSLINGAGIDPYTGLDQFNRVVDNRWFSTATSADLDRIQHGYDRAGNRLWRKNTVAEAAGVYLDELYAYDGLYRLSRLDRGQLNGTNTGIVAGTEDFTQAWGLDATGNWATFDQADTGGPWTLTQTRTSNTVNEITGITGGGWILPAYDAAGNMVTMPQPATPATSFDGIYDAWNRIVSIWVGGLAVGIYRFDGLNRRASKLVSGVLRDIYYSTAWQAIEERLGGSTTPDRQFVWGLRYIDDLVLRDRGAERLFGIRDPNWNLTAIADVTGAIQERYRYTAYGLPTVLTPTFAVRGASSFSWETLFGGYRWDAETSTCHARNRWLNNPFGCWLSRDPASLTLRDLAPAIGLSRDPLGYYRESATLEQPNAVMVRVNEATWSFLSEKVESALASGDTNIYRYVRNNPLVFVDPSGEICVYHGAYLRIERVPGSWPISPPWRKWRCVYELHAVWDDCDMCEYCPRNNQIIYGPPAMVLIPGLLMCNLVGVPRYGLCAQIPGK